MKKTVLFGLLALSAYAFADGEMAATDNMKSMQQDQKDQMSGAQKKNQKMMQERVTLMSARPESDNGWYLFADALYWHADVGSADWALKYPDGNVSNPANGHPINVHSLNFKWSWGFKVGIGANIDHDMWDTNFYYTWFHTHNSNGAGVSSAVNLAIGAPDGFITDNMGNNVLFSSGSSHWNIHYSMFDWELGRWHYVSKNLALRPHVGIKGGWIHQHVKEHLNNLGVNLDSTGIVLRESFQNNFWGVGPSIGVNTLWVLGNAGSVLQHRFSLFGDFGGAFMYGHFSNKHRELVINSPTSHGFHVNGLDRNLAVTMLQGILGLSWDTSFNKERNHFMMKVGYEFQYWFRQNQMIQLTSFEGAMRRFSDDLALQGITAEFRFDF